MPTVANEGGVRFVIYPKDHQPPHVHVWIGGESVTRIELDSGEFMGEPTSGNRREIMNAYRRNAATIRKAWDHYHGEEAEG